jgi:D-sedoheptulose 7-phosphate isomerase
MSVSRCSGIATKVRVDANLSQGGRSVNASSGVAAAFDRRTDPGQELAGQAERIVSAAHAMARRFHQGGKLVAFGTGSGSTDAQHVAVEFVHPVIVGKRALPAISLTSDAATITAVAARAGLDRVFAHQIAHLAEPADIALGIAAGAPSPPVMEGLRAAGEHGLLTILLVGGPDGFEEANRSIDHVLATSSSDPRIVKEIHVSTYHLLWELVHLFLEQPGVLGPEAP